jgi:hypothetical protein
MPTPNLPAMTDAPLRHPRDVLFEEGDAVPDLPVCDHYCGVEARMRKSLDLQAELGPVFDVTWTARTAPRWGARSSTPT